MFGKSKEKKNNDNELESYGVWVKHGATEEAAPAETENDSLDFNTELDLPDFDDDSFSDSDFSDMFKDDSTDSTEADALDFDTTLSADELANITDDTEITTEEIDLDTTFGSDDLPAEETSDDLQIEDSSMDLPDFDLDETISEDVSEEVSSDAEEITETPVEETAVEDSIIEESFDDITADSSAETTDDVSLDSFDEVNTDDFNIFETEDTDAPAAPIDETFEITEEAPAEAESEEISFGDDEEISLDDFMDEGFSDESVAAGNNGFEPGKEPSAAATEEVSFDDEEISLDDFIDAGEFESAPEVPSPQEDSVTDEPPLEMDITFDDSADSVATEDNIAAEVDFDDDQDEEEADEEVVTEEVNLDDFSSTVSSGSDNIETEEIDLSDFGIDSSADETPITQDVEESKLKETVVDYDLSVDNDNTSAAPVVNVIPEASESIEEVSEIESLDIPEEISEPAAAAPADSTSVSNSLLEQIVADLSGLKDEINQLKVNLAEIKEHENASPAPAEEDDIFENTEPVDEGGFFASDDTDDTIALSADELSNIMNTTSVVEEVVEPVAAEGTEIAEEPVVSEETEPVFEETSVDIAEEPVIEASVEEVTEEAPAEDDLDISGDDTLSFEYENENLQEPDMSSIEIEESDFVEEDDELPSEISIEKTDDILVESDSNDFMDSVADSTPETVTEEPVIEDSAIEEVAEEPVIEESEPVIEDTIVEETTEEPVFEDTVEEEVSEETVVETEDTDEFSFDTVDSLMSDNIAESNAFVEEAVASEEIAEDEPVIEETVVEEVAEEPLFEETAVEESEVAEDPVIEDEITEEVTVEETPSFDEIDSSDNELSESNIDYLTAKSDDDITEEPVNSDLKQDIKSVLLYMDQLLENLPEDKIIEFAKSDEFTTYKKLFSELGLS